jgi:small subunit ribosomal protein S1
MGWSRAVSPAAVVATGQEITVKVLRVDAGTGQIALGLKQLMADPWLAVPATYAVGQRRPGRVTRLAEFGAFVELEPGIEGLAHASTFQSAGPGGRWSKAVSVGLTGEFEVLGIDLEKKRISLAPVDPGTPRRAAADEADDVRAYAERERTTQGESFGSLAEKLKGALKRDL